MSQRIAIKRFVAPSFDLEVRPVEASGSEVWFVDAREVEAAVGATEGLMASDRVSRWELVEGEMPPVDTLGMLSGDGMWVGRGGVSLLPTRPANESTVNCFR
jgi:hypothetical protein